MILLKKIVIGESKDEGPLFVETDEKEAKRLVESGSYRLATPDEQNKYTREKQRPLRLQE